MDFELLVSSLARETVFSFSRSSGAGGQNVNKVSTRVTVSVPVEVLEGLSDADRVLLRSRLANRISTEGILSLSVQDTRSQLHNRDLALERLEALVFNALKKQKKRRPTRPSAAAHARRLDGKKQGGIKKHRRRKPVVDD
jgi:ribosome-associated protein